MADDFEHLSSLLRDWYVNGDQRAAAEFVSDYLQPTAAALAKRVMPEHDVADCVQVVMTKFLDRDKQVGLVAETAGYWYRGLQQRVIDVLRKQGRLRARFVPVEDVSVIAGIEPSADPSERMLALIAATDGWLSAQLAAMPATRRVYLLASSYAVLGPFMVAADRTYLLEKSRLDRPQLEAALMAAEDPVALLPLLFGPEKAAAEPERCREAFERGRRRAINDLLNVIAKEDS